MKRGYLTLKWGTLKSWNFEGNEKALKAFDEYSKLGYSASSMMQKDTQRQKELIIEMIDAVPGKICNDWSGKMMTKKEAREYVLSYVE